MAPQLRVLISNDKAYPPTALCPVNSPTPTKIKTDKFEGEVSVFVRGFTGEGAAGDGHEYFDTPGRGDMTYGIVVRGRYLDNPQANDVLFGNVFEHPIRDSLPWGTSVATKFMYFIDPTLELDVYCDKPWALSPAVATMNHLSVRPNAGADEAASLAADTAAAPGPVIAIDEDAVSVVPSEIPEDKKKDVATRRKFFANKDHRNFKLEGEVGMEFSNGILDFNTLSVTLPRPFSLSVQLLKYWDGQPVTYVCRKRSDDPLDLSGVYWAVAFEIIDEEAKKELEKRGGSVKPTTEAEAPQTETKKPEEEVKISDDLD